MSNPEPLSSAPKPPRKPRATKKTEDGAAPARRQRPKPPSTEGVPTATAPLSRYESHTPAQIDRSAILNAPYNPRVIDGDSRARLEATLKTDGLVSPPTWNKRTGNLVGGHQRLDVLDDLHEGKPYSVTVAMIDVDERQEREINVKLNSRDLQGDYDLARMNDLAAEHKAMAPDADLETAFGMSQDSLADLNIDPSYYLPEAAPAERAIVEESGEIGEFKRLRKEHKIKKRLEDLRVQLANVIVRFPDDMSLDKIEQLRSKLFARLQLRPDFNEPIIPFWRVAAALGIEGGTIPEEEED